MASAPEPEQDRDSHHVSEATIDEINRERERVMQRSVQTVNNYEMYASLVAVELDKQI